MKLCPNCIERLKRKGHKSVCPNCGYWENYNDDESSDKKEAAFERIRQSNKHNHFIDRDKLER